jgi:hypothetical protein
MIYRLWNYGSINLFLWGDPDYGARFSKSLGMAGGSGFEINSPLSLKGGMEAYARDPWHIHREGGLRTCRWEDERYWAYYLVFGRYGYSSATGRELIAREFGFRFGAAGEEILRAYECAGKVLPLITTIHFPVHPSLHYWPELYPGAALFAKNNYDRLYGGVDYAGALPSDEELFYSIAAYAEDELAGTLKPKYSPLVLRNTLHGLAEGIRRHLAGAGCSAGSEGEKLGVWVDFSMIAGIADFHSWKTAAAYYLYRYERTRDREDLPRSYGAMLNAVHHWEELSGLGSRYYHDDLQFNAGTGMGRHRNWRFRLEAELSRDLEDLEKVLREAGLDPEPYRQNPSREYCPIAEGSPLRLRSGAPASWDPGRDLPLEVRAGGPEEPGEVFLNYRRMDHTEGEYRHVPMSRAGETYRGIIPGEYFTGDFDMIVYFSALDLQGRGVIFPGIYSAEYPSPYFVIKTGGNHG